MPGMSNSARTSSSKPVRKGIPTYHGPLADTSPARAQPPSWVCSKRRARRAPAGSARRSRRGRCRPQFSRARDGSSAASDLHHHDPPPPHPGDPAKTGITSTRASASRAQKILNTATAGRKRRNTMPIEMIEEFEGTRSRSSASAAAAPSTMIAKGPGRGVHLRQHRRPGAEPLGGLGLIQLGSTGLSAGAKPEANRAAAEGQSTTSARPSPREHAVHHRRHGRRHHRRAP